MQIKTSKDYKNIHDVLISWNSATIQTRKSGENLRTCFGPFLKSFLVIIYVQHTGFHATYLPTLYVHILLLRIIFLFLLLFCHIFLTHLFYIQHETSTYSITVLKIIHSRSGCIFFQIILFYTDFYSKLLLRKMGPGNHSSIRSKCYKLCDSVVDLLSAFTHINGSKRLWMNNLAMIWFGTL